MAKNNTKRSNIVKSSRIPSDIFDFKGQSQNNQYFENEGILFKLLAESRNELAL